MSLVKNYSGRIKLLGGSSGAIVSGVVATDVDIVRLIELFRLRFIKNRHRIGGCVGVYSKEVGLSLDQLFRVLFDHS